MKLNLFKCVFVIKMEKVLGFLVGCNGIEPNPEKIQAILDMTPP
jgi:hypothetical protein